VILPGTGDYEYFLRTNHPLDPRNDPDDYQEEEEEEEE
jgi:hypothetical protein